jgi:tetratricopeptide (TPR) repeat protein
MFRDKFLAKSVISFFAISSLLINGTPVRANELVPSDDLNGGASVFVFRGSSKQPQASGGSANAFRAGGGGAAARRARVKSQLAASRKRKADAAKARAAAVARARARERVAKLKLSNTLTTRAETLMAAGNIDGAIPVFREAIKSNAKNADAISGLSEALTAKGIETAGDGGNEAGMPFLTEAVKLNAKNEVAYAKIGDIHDARGRNKEAILAYDNALAIDPQLSSLYLPLGLAHVEQGNLVEAETYLTKAETAGFGTAESKMARITILSKQGRNAEAIAALDKIIQAEPTNGNAYYQKGLTYNRMNDQNAAMTTFQKTIQVDPANGGAWYEIGVAQYNKGDYAGALASYQKAVAIDPNNALVNANLASTFRQLQRFADANAAYKLAEPGNEKNPDLYSEWGFCLGKTNEWDKSVARLNTARTLSPSAVDNTNLGWAYYNAARQDKEAGREVESKQKLELARQYLQTAVSLDPKMDAAYLNLGSTNNSLGDHKAAADALNQALALNQNWVIAMNQLGVSYKGLGNLVGAIDILKRATSLDSRNQFGLFSLGEVYHLNGNDKEAKKIQSQLKKLNPAFAGQLDGVLKGKIPKVPGVKVPGVRFPY